MNPINDKNQKDEIACKVMLGNQHFLNNFLSVSDSRHKVLIPFKY